MDTCKNKVNLKANVVSNGDIAATIELSDINNQEVKGELYIMAWEYLTVALIGVKAEEVKLLDLYGNIEIIQGLFKGHRAQLDIDNGGIFLNINERSDNYKHGKVKFTVVEEKRRESGGGEAKLSKLRLEIEDKIIEINTDYRKELNIEISDN